VWAELFGEARMCVSDLAGTGEILISTEVAAVDARDTGALAIRGDACDEFRSAYQSPVPMLLSRGELLWPS
jgi:hypothetical protein